MGVMTICGFMEGWDIIRCRTVTIAEAMEAWGPYFPIILGTNERRRYQVGPYQVWRMS